MSAARRLLVTTQVVFFACVAVCALIAYGASAESSGISYFGVHAPTLPLVVVAYAVAAVGLWRAAALLEGCDAVVTSTMRVVAVGLPLELVTPYNHGAFFNWAHMVIGVVIGVAQMGASASVAWRYRQAALSLATLVQLAGGLAAAMSLPDWGFNHMLESEVLFAFGYAWCLVQWTYAPRVLAVGALAPRGGDVADAT